MNETVDTSDLHHVGFWYSYSFGDFFVSLMVDVERELVACRSSR